MRRHVAKVLICACTACGMGACDSSFSSDNGGTPADAADNNSAPDAATSADALVSAIVEGGTDANCAASSPCTPQEECHTGAISCAGGSATCAVTGFVPDLSACHGGNVCVRGDCVTNALQAVTTSTNLSSASIEPGRTCGSGVAYAVASLGATSATLASAPANGCLAAGDAVLLLNAQGTKTSTLNVGRYEVLHVASASGTTVTFDAPKVGFYGAGASDDTGIGTSAQSQHVVLQRVPVIAQLTITSTGALTADAWDGGKGGVIALRAGKLVVAGKINAAALGYRSGAWSEDDATCTENVATESGESIAGAPTVNVAANAGGSGGIASGSALFTGTPFVNASAGHITAGQAGQAGSGRSPGAPGAAYGSLDASLLDFGSGGGGAFSCAAGTFATYAEPRSTQAGGIILLEVGTLQVTGTVTASAANAGPVGASSGGSIVIRSAAPSLGDGLVTAIGSTSTSSGTSFTNKGSDGKIAVCAPSPTSVTGTTKPSAIVNTQCY
jgi:hypothetical protein